MSAVVSTVMRSRFLHYSPVLASLLLLLAIFMPAVNTAGQVHRYLLVFDISQSMNVEDVLVDSKPESRLELSKSAARQLLQDLPCGSEVALAIFAATRTVTLLTTLEVCEHYSGLLTSLNAIDGRMRFKNASSVGKGVHQSLRAANEIGNGTAIAMFTDGHEAPPLRHGQTGLPKSEGHDIKGFIIGVGGEQPSRIPRVDNNGKPLGFWQPEDVTQLPANERSSSQQAGEELSSLREPHLRELSQISGLEYTRLQNEKDLVSDLTDTSFSLEQTTPSNFAWIPASLALLLLCLRFIPLLPVRAA